MGQKGQERLGQSAVAVIGCGALGSVAAEMLVRAGIGRISLIDRDFVEASNLQRQTLYREKDADQALPKAEAAHQALREINSAVEIRAHVLDLNPRSADLLQGHEILVDGTDNFRTRYLINDFSCRERVPWCYAGCVSSHGMAFLFRPGKTPCLRCFIAELPAPGTLDTCDTAGIIAPAVHAAAAFQVTQVLKCLVGSKIEPRLFQFDVWEDDWRSLRVAAGPDPGCPCCGLGRFSFLEGLAGDDRVTSLCGRDAIQLVPTRPASLNLEEIDRRLRPVARVVRNEYLLRIHLPEHEIALFRDGRSIIKGTDDPAVAQSLYDRYIGR